VIFPARSGPGPGATGGAVICQPDSALDRMDRTVREMHTRSGLLDDVRRSETSVHETEQAVLDLPLATDDPDARVVIAGSSVHFDLSFIRRHMPRLAAVLSYRCFDVSAVVLACRSLGMPRDENEPPAAHRARADLDGSIRRMRECVAWLGRGAAPVTSQLLEHSQAAAAAYVGLSKLNAKALRDEIAALRAENMKARSDIFAVVRENQALRDRACELELAAGERSRG